MPHSRRKLTPNDVRLIRRDVRAGRLVAADYGVSATTVRRLRAGLIYAEVPDLPAGSPAWPAGRYRTVCLDPPWHIQRVKVVGARCLETVDLDYATMSFEAIAALPVGELLASDAWVFMWQIQAYLARSWELLAGWGLRYRWLMSWVKGGGFKPLRWPTSNTEFVVVASRGRPELLDTTDWRTGFTADRTRVHSEKPVEFYRDLARCTPGPRIDLFARQPRPGFDTWGLDVPGGFQPDGAHFAGPGMAAEQAALL